MANEKHLQILHQGVEAWNEWVKGHDAEIADLSNADFSGAYLSRSLFREANLSGVNFSGANLSNANLEGANLCGANLSGARLFDTNLVNVKLHDANLNNARLQSSDLQGADLINATLIDARLGGTDLSDADLRGANLSSAKLNVTNFTGVKLAGANFASAELFRSIFADVDLRGVEGLESISHFGPSEISISTIYLSGGQIPERFLRACGVPDSFIMQIPSLVAATQPIQFHSCFISYSSKDEEFARRLHERMRAAGLGVWFAPEDIKGGEKLYEQIDRAIQVHDRLLLVLSENSMRSEWVMTELRRARKAEVKEGRRKLFPIRLTDFDTLRAWECFDADQGKDLAVEVREYFIPDFSNWKSHDDFEEAFERLLNDLKASV